jgi:hypothetical protein
MIDKDRGCDPTCRPRQQTGSTIGFFGFDVTCGMCSHHNTQRTSILQQRKHTMRPEALSPQAPRGVDFERGAYWKEHGEVDKAEHAVAIVNRLGTKTQSLQNELDDMRTKMTVLRARKMTIKEAESYAGMKARMPELREELAEIKAAHQEAMLDLKLRTFSPQKSSHSCKKGLHKK